jgi:hypothetical protein
MAILEPTGVSVNLYTTVLPNQIRFLASANQFPEYALVPHHPLYLEGLSAKVEGSKTTLSHPDCLGGCYPAVGEGFD